MFDSSKRGRGHPFGLLFVSSFDLECNLARTGSTQNDSSYLEAGTPAGPTGTYPTDKSEEGFSASLLCFPNVCISNLEYPFEMREINNVNGHETRFMQTVQGIDGSSTMVEKFVDVGNG